MHITPSSPGTFVARAPRSLDAPAGETHEERRLVVWRFGELAYDARHGLTNGQRRIRLSPIESAVLEALLEARGATLSRDDLVTRVWGRDDVSDDSISRAIFRLRRALRPAGRTGIIETLYGRGYRMAVAVVAQGSEAPALHDALACLRSARDALSRLGACDAAAALRHLDPAEHLLGGLAASSGGRPCLHA